MPASLNIQFTDPGTSAAGASAAALVQQAFAEWTRHFDASFGTYTLALSFGGTVAGDASLAFSPLVAVGGAPLGSGSRTYPTLLEPAFGLAVTGRSAGTAPVTLGLTLDPGFLNGSRPLSDALGPVEREFGHALGIKSTPPETISGPVSGGLAYLATSSKSQQTVFERTVQTEPNTSNPPAAFDYGPNAVAAFGRRVQVNFYDTDTAYAGRASVESLTEPASSLQPLDVALLRDAGIAALTDQELGEHQVARLYVAAFGRTADGPGLVANYAALRAGLSLAQLGDTFVQSAEFANRYGTVSDAGFVAALYQNVLGRAGDVAGVALYQEVLRSGLSRGAVLASFSDSEEERARLSVNPNIAYAATAEAQVNRLYGTVFERDPDPVGFAANVKAVINGTSLHDVAMRFLQSDESVSHNGRPVPTRMFVDRLYVNTLATGPSQAAEDLYLRALTSGAYDYADLAVSLSESTEHVQSLASHAAARDAKGYSLDTQAPLGLIPFISAPPGA